MASPQVTVRATSPTALMLGLLLCICPSLSLAQPQAISVDTIYPPIIQLGTSQDLQVIGINTQDVDQLQINHPGIRAELLTDPPLPFDDLPQKRFGHFRLHVAQDVPAGIYQAIAIGRYGSANPRPLVVCQEPVSLLPTQSPDPIELKEGTIYLGQTVALNKQKYRIPKSLTLEQPHARILVSTRSIDSPALIKMTLKASEQRTIASSRSVGNLPAKISLATLSSEALDQAKELTLEINDELYRGGQPFNYLLTIGKNPNANLVSPSLTKPPSAALVRDLPVLPAVDATTLLSHETALVEVAAPSEISFPSGKSFIAKVAGPIGTSLECQIVSNSIGQPTDYRIIVFQSQKEGKLEGQLQVIEDSPPIGWKGFQLGNLDPHAIVNIPESTGGTVYLLVQNLQTRVDASDQIATLRLAPPQARFQCIAHLGAWTNTPLQSRGSGAYLQRGGTFPIHVIAHRQNGFAGPIALRFEGLPEGVTAPPVTIQPTQNEIDVLLTASDQAAAWNGPLRVIASSKQGEQIIEQAVPFATVWQNPSAERGPIQTRLCDELWLSVKEDLSPISIQPTQTDIVKIKAGEKTVLPLTITRRVGGEAKAIMRPQNLPPKVTLTEWEVAPNAATTEREIVTAADAPLGTYTICFLAEMVWKMPLHPESLTRHTEYRDRLVAKLPTFDSNPDKPALEAAIAAANARIETLSKETAPRDYGTHFYTGRFTLVIE
ncbi:MAG: hypothetical protein MUC83_17220 [Pirellula sp.]|jgi:hypothetical protein|nr:hypothetical protein [Pirellula sp.]